MPGRTPDTNPVPINEEQARFQVFIDSHTPFVEIRGPDGRGNMSTQYRAYGAGYLKDGNIGFEIEGKEIIANAFTTFTVDKLKPPVPAERRLERVDWIEFFNFADPSDIAVRGTRAAAFLGRFLHHRNKRAGSKPHGGNFDWENGRHIWFHKYHYFEDDDGDAAARWMVDQFEVSEAENRAIWLPASAVLTNRGE